MRARDLHADVCTGVARADEQHAAGLQLRRIAIGTGVHLDDARVELFGEVRHYGRPVETRRNHDVLGLEAMLAAQHGIAFALLGESIHRHSSPHRQIEPGSVGLEIVGRLARRGIRPAGCRKPPAG